MAEILIIELLFFKSQRKKFDYIPNHQYMAEIFFNFCSYLSAALEYHTKIEKLIVYNWQIFWRWESISQWVIRDGGWERERQIKWEVECKDLVVNLYSLRPTLVGTVWLLLLFKKCVDLWYMFNFILHLTSILRPTIIQSKLRSIN